MHRTIPRGVHKPFRGRVFTIQVSDSLVSPRLLANCDVRSLHPRGSVIPQIAVRVFSAYELRENFGTSQMSPEVSDSWREFKLFDSRLTGSYSGRIA